MCSHHTPTLWRAHPSLALAASTRNTVSLKLGIGSGKVFAIGGDDGVHARAL